MSHSTTTSLNELLTTNRFKQTTSSIEQTYVKHEEERENTNISSIEQVPRKSPSNQGEIPTKVDALIDNKMFRNRYKRLIREGHVESLMYLADYATTSSAVKTPSRWFAKVCSVKNWEGTLRWVTKMLAVSRKVLAVADRLGSKVTNFIYKQAHKGLNVEHLAALAKESGKEPYKLFCWLCVHNPQGVKA